MFRAFVALLVLMTIGMTAAAVLDQPQTPDRVTASLDLEATGDADMNPDVPTADSQTLTVLFTANSLDRAPRATVQEDDLSVTVTVTVEDGCADVCTLMAQTTSMNLTLDQPLGLRTLIDGSTGDKYPAPGHSMPRSGYAPKPCGPVPLLSPFC